MVSRERSAPISATKAREKGKASGSSTDPTPSATNSSHGRTDEGGKATGATLRSSTDSTTPTTDLHHAKIHKTGMGTDDAPHINSIQGSSSKHRPQARNQGSTRNDSSQDNRVVSFNDYLTNNVYVMIWKNKIRPTIQHTGKATLDACDHTIYRVFTSACAVFRFFQARPWLFWTCVAILLWFFPHSIWTLAKYGIVGIAGHLILGMASLRWFKQYREETLPLFKILGFEFTVRNGQEYAPGLLRRAMKRMWVAFTQRIKKTNKQRKTVRWADEQPSIQGPSPTVDRNPPPKALSGYLPPFEISPTGNFLTPVYVDGLGPVTSPSWTFIPRVGMLFLQDGLTSNIETRRLMLHIQVTKAFLVRVDSLIDGLTDLLTDLSPPSNDGNTTIHFHISTKDNLHSLASQVRKFLYKAADKKHFDHAWWHDRVCQSDTLNATDIEELSTWVKICLHMLMTKKRVKLLCVLEEAHQDLIKQLFQDGLAAKKPRSRSVRVAASKMEKGPKMFKRKAGMETGPGVSKKPDPEQVVGEIDYSGVAGILAGLGRKVVVNVDQW